MLLHQFIRFILLLGLLSFNTLINAGSYEKASFAAGCFWCAQHDFQQLTGVKQVISGYTGGHTLNPSYEQVSAGGTGHFEAITVVYDPHKISYTKLLSFFWHNIDPTNGKGQFCDVGTQYRAVIFYHTDGQKKAAERSKIMLEQTSPFKHIQTLILPAGEFYPAENYHQHYAEKNPLRYRFYRYTCGRDHRLRELWGIR